MAVSKYADEITNARVLRVWWAMIWRAMLSSALAGLFAGGLAGFIAGLLGRVDLAGLAGATAGWVVSIPISFYILRLVLRKQFGGFSVRFVAEGAPGTAAAVVDSTQGGALLQHDL
jgi:hypothetical protein